MNRIAQGLLMVLLGAAALSCTLASDLYLNYVQPAFRPFLVGAGAVLLVLGVIAIVADMRAADGGGREHDGHGDDGHGHDHARGPGVAWLLLLPVVAVFAVAPPALGAYSAATGAAAAPPAEADAAALGDLGTEAAAGEPVEMELQEFVMRAWTDEERAMAGREIELTGFAVPNPEGEGWYLARLQMACCAADAIVNRVLITDEPEPDKDSWWTVRGTWVEPEGDLQAVRDHRIEVETMSEVADPPDPYE
ncbi:putative repeat protein (TIGR03943 family) [Spinactinospora alkalitolerans]|uniref:Putative repeat protein (TIGR03943 family) n=1 Tax=Spinactinospora alkalitolerans TaxID=687207 RepID=A0A852TU47_9ACTN|nr:TIGR03943 family protein [Spinactinospora alkalitolerans]NYE46827.1 putative repeat protein (TIGR03943 family) [Spinactinospora alkalitolerans]